MAKPALKFSLLSGAALVALVVADPHSAQAQMYSSGPGVYLSLEGRYLMSNDNKISLYPDTLFTNAPIASANAQARLDKGWGGKAMLGYRFNNNWDVGFGFSAGWLKGKKGRGSGNVVTSTDGFGTSSYASGEAKTKLTYQVADFEAGYNWTMGNNSNLRLFGGVRFAHFNTISKGSDFYGAGTFTPGDDFNVITSTYGNYKRKTTYWGVGPRLGVNGQFGIGASGFNVFGSLSGAVLFGKFKDKHSGSYSGFTTSGPVGSAFSAKDKNKSKVVPNVEGELGLGYNFNTGGGSTVGIQVGYRAEKWWGVTSDAPLYTDNVGSAEYKSSHSSDVLIHGPFVRLVATFGSAPAAPPPPPPPPPPMAMAKKSFIVFFDFDKSNITSQAQKTINDAVAAAKAGNSARVTLTGHTDRSGSEQYNMALSLRRAEAVKANMIRQGIPANAIVVIGKGESQPLVPTADGVREPQNRRVEIVI